MEMYSIKNKPVCVYIYCVFCVLLVCLSEISVSPVVVPAVGQCMFKKAAFNHYHLSRSLSLSCTPSCRVFFLSFSLWC